MYLKLPGGTANPGYLARHKRLWRKRGSAKDLPCVDCGKCNSEWSQVHGTDGLDLENDYVPRCVSCHRKYDGAYANRAKLNYRQVASIKRLYSEGGYTYAMLGKAFGVSPSTVGDIIKGNTWS